MTLPHFERATRRAFLRRGLSATAVVLSGGLVGACSRSDEATFSSTPTSSSTSRSTATSSGRSATTATTATTRSGSSPTSGVANGNPASATVSFTYKPSESGGRTRNPYIAAWVEDADGEMVALLSVWYLEREGKYLRELTGYSAAARSVTAAQLDAVTGATRAAGEYRVQWDGTALDGSALSGTCTLWVEASREHGPHSVTSGPIEVGAAGTTTIPSDGELSEVTVTVA